MKKADLISGIKKITNEYGWLNSRDLELDSDVMYNSIGKDHYQLIDQFERNCVCVTEYISEMVVGTFNVDYADLSGKILLEIYRILRHAELYNIEMLIGNKQSNF